MNRAESLTQSTSLSFHFGVGASSSNRQIDVLVAQLPSIRLIMLTPSGHRDQSGDVDQYQRHISGLAAT